MSSSFSLESHTEPNYPNLMYLFKFGLEENQTPAPISDDSPEGLAQTANRVALLAQNSNLLSNVETAYRNYYQIEPLEDGVFCPQQSRLFNLISQNVQAFKTEVRTEVATLRGRVSTNLQELNTQIKETWFFNLFKLIPLYLERSKMREAEKSLADSEIKILVN